MSGRSFNLTGRQLFWKILLPAALPTIFVGLRLGMIFALINIVGVEFLIDQSPARGRKRLKRLRITGASPATNPIITMVVALRPKMTRNKGYIRTMDAAARAATQVSVAMRSSATRWSSAPSPIPTTVRSNPAASASPAVSRNRLRTSSSNTTRPKLAMSCEGRGTT